MLRDGLSKSEDISFSKLFSFSITHPYSVKPDINKIKGTFLKKKWWFWKFFYVKQAFWFSYLTRYNMFECVLEGFYPKMMSTLMTSLICIWYFARLDIWNSTLFFLLPWGKSGFSLSAWKCCSALFLIFWWRQTLWWVSC